MCSAKKLKAYSALCAVSRSLGTALHSKTGCAAGKRSTVCVQQCNRQSAGHRPLYLDSQRERLARIHGVEEGAQAPHVGLLGVVKLAGIWLQRQSCGMSCRTTQPANGDRQS